MGVAQLRNPQRSLAQWGKGGRNEWPVPSGRGQDCHQRPRRGGQTSLLTPEALLKGQWTLFKVGFLSRSPKQKFQLHPNNIISIFMLFFLSFFILFLHNWNKLPQPNEHLGVDGRVKGSILLFSILYF